MAAFDRRLQRAIALAAITFVKPKIRSYKGKPIPALQRALRLGYEGQDAYIEIPHFWAVYVHDGRQAPVYPRNGTFLIWWKDPRQDPRLRGGSTPQRASQLRHLTPSQFRRAMRIHRQALASGGDSPIVVTRRVNRSTPGNPFFSSGPRGGMQGFWRVANMVGEPEVRGEVFRVLGEHLGVSTFVPRVVAGLGVSFPFVEETVSARLL